MDGRIRARALERLDGGTHIVETRRDGDPGRTIDPKGAAKRWIPAGGAAIAFIWLLSLSLWLGVKPGSVIARRVDALFDSDTALSISRLSDDRPKPFLHSRYLVHSFETFVWRPISRTLQRPLRPFVNAAELRILVPMILVASIAAAGFGALLMIGLGTSAPKSIVALVFVLYLAFTSNVIVALPEHYGISSGLLTMSFLTWMRGARRTRSGQARLIALGAAAAGTTISNGVLTLLCFARDLKRPRRWIAAAAAGCLGFGLGIAILARTSSSVNWYVQSFSNERLIDHPASAAIYGLAGLVYPAIGPVPPIPTVERANGRQLNVSYEPIEWGQFDKWQIVPSIVWCVLLATAIFGGLRNRDTRAGASVLILWVLFNLTLHNLWGDEFFLYSAHWAWALAGLLMLGLGQTKTRWVAAAVVVLVPAQLYTLAGVVRALHSIPR